MHQFHKLTVWQKSIQMVEDIYKITETFPKSEKFGLVSQMRRASVSIPSNIAEGCGRNSANQLKYYLGVASGSASELYTQIILATNLKLLVKEVGEELKSKLSYILNMIFRLQKTLA